MKTRGLLLSLLCLSALAAPAAAQLIHVSTTLEDADILLRANDNSIPWDGTPAFVTELDVSYDLRVPLGTHDPRSFWRMKGYAPGPRESFEISRPVDYISFLGHGISFVYFAPNEMVQEDFRLTLVFNDPISLNGPPYPLPPLGFTDNFFSSGFSINGGNSFYNIENLIGAFGGGRIISVATEFVPIPEPSSYAVGAVLLSIGLIAARWRRELCRRRLQRDASC